jgi:hypothetical protein
MGKPSGHLVISRNPHFRPHVRITCSFVVQDGSVGRGVTSENESYVRFEVFTAVTMKNGVFWDEEWCLLGCYAVLLL